MPETPWVMEDPRKYVQITKALREKIASGVLQPGDAVSMAYTAQEWKAARQTVGKALRVLEAEGLLKRYPGIGYHVISRRT